MKHLQLNKKWLLATAGLLLVLLTIKIVLFLTAKPKITVDYVAEYNKITRPANYDPNDNAAHYYQKAFDAFVEMPEELRKPYINWPADFNSTEQTLLEKWLASNSQTFEYFREAVNKPYYWIKRTPVETDNYLENNYIGNILCHDVIQLRYLAKALGWDAKLKATKGEFKVAFEDILDCYKAGNHKCDPNLFIWEQDFGLYIKQDAVQNGFIILDKSNVDNKSLRFLQDALQQELDRDTYIPGCQAEKLYKLDHLQRIFIDNGRGTGRLWWRFGFGVVISSLSHGEADERKIRMSCFTGPTRKQVVEQIEQTCALFNQVMAKTPCQAKNKGRDYFEEINNINNQYFSLKILDIGIIDPSHIFNLYHETRTQTKALIAVCAILRFKEENNRLPATLDELVSAGYLESVPMDPYSDVPLVYKPNEDKFRLYRIGEDFSYDGGVIEIRKKQAWGINGAQTVPYIYSPDVVYWPFKDLKKLRYELTINNNEAKVRKEIE